MTKRQYWLGVFTLLAVLTGTGIVGYVSTIRYNKQVEINSLKEVEKQKIIQEEKTKRTKERMQWIPWYKSKN